MENDMKLVKSIVPFEIPLNCLLSLYRLPMIQSPWNEDDLDDYSERENFGFNIFKLVGNKAELSPNFPGKLILKLSHYHADTMVPSYHGFMISCFKAYQDSHRQ